MIKGYTSIDQSRATKVLQNLDLAKRDLLNHFKIRKGEKWTNPEFGSDLPLLVFQPLDDETIREIEQDVISVVSYDPRFSVKDIVTRVVETSHSVTVTIELIYLPTTTATELQVKFDKEFAEN